MSPCLILWLRINVLFLQGMVKIAWPTPGNVRPKVPCFFQTGSAFSTEASKFLTTFRPLSNHCREFPGWFILLMRSSNSTACLWIALTDLSRSITNGNSSHTSSHFIILSYIDRIFLLSWSVPPVFIPDPYRFIFFQLRPAQRIIFCSAVDSI